MAYDKVMAHAKKMRANPTEAERHLWIHLAARTFLGLRFNRQFVISHIGIDQKRHFHIVDFYCHEKKLLIEVDGKYHESDLQEIYDKIRTESLQQMGFHLIRFTNFDVLNNIGIVKKRLKIFIEDECG